MECKESLYMAGSLKKKAS